MDEQSLIRHYLPAIAAFVGFILMALFFPFAEPADRLGESFDLKAQVAGAAGDFCGLNPVTGMVNLELETWTPQFADKDQGGLIGWRSDGPKEHSPPIRIVKIAGCYRCIGSVHFWTKNSAGTYTELTGPNMPMDLTQFKDYDYSQVPGGGILVDRITADVMNDPWPASVAKYTITKDPVPYTISGLTEKKDGANRVEEKTVSEILGSKVNTHNADLEAKSKTYQFVRITSVNNVKAAFDSITVNPPLKETTDFTKKLFVCKNTIKPGDNVCDFEGSECTAPAQCQDGIDNEATPDGKTDFPNDPGCSSAADPLEGDEAQCQDGKDNETPPDGRFDFPNDPGCSSPTDGNEGDEPLCKDGKDNDEDGKIDTADPGCTNPDDNTEGNPQCSDLGDNDHDDKIDMADRGCETEKDDDEKNPPVDRNVLLKKSAIPKLIIQDKPEQDDLLKFTTDCKDCKIELSQDPNFFIGGLPAAKENFTIIAKLIAPDNKISTTIVAVGDYFQEKRLFTRKEKEYVGIGEDPENQYLPGIIQGEDPDMAFKVKIGSAFDVLPVTQQLIPSLNGVAAQNASIQWHLLSAKDSEGTDRLFLGKFRHWDLSTTTDTKITAAHLVSILSAKGGFAKCVAGFQVYPQFETLFETPGKFQEFLETLALCQRK